MVLSDMIVLWARRETVVTPSSVRFEKEKGALKKIGALGGAANNLSGCRFSTDDGPTEETGSSYQMRR
jgi:hypothetical protein